jgi:PIN domain nuclease of toxin-antitoxin system
MKLLLDTHSFIWWDGEPSKLSARATALCSDPNNILLFSVVSAWEIQIKLHLGKLTLHRSLGDLIDEQRRVNGLEVLSVTLPHVLALSGLPDHHKDPFDRLLIAQANCEGATLVSADPVFAQYPVTVAW